MAQQRYGAAPLEGRAAIARWDASGHLTVWLSSQMPHIARTGLATFLRPAGDDGPGHLPDVGGGFGPKCVVYQEEVAAGRGVAAARHAPEVDERPGEDLLPPCTAEQIHRVARPPRARRPGDSRCPSRSTPPTAPTRHGRSARGSTRGRRPRTSAAPTTSLLYERSVHAVVTNKAPMGPYRGVGRVMACLTIERVMDELATRLELDRLESPSAQRGRVEFPYETATGLVFESGDYPRSLELLDRGDRVGVAPSSGTSVLATEGGRPGRRRRVRGRALLVRAAVARQSQDGDDPRLRHRGAAGRARRRQRGSRSASTTTARGTRRRWPRSRPTSSGSIPSQVEVVYGDTDSVSYGARHLGQPQHRLLRRGHGPRCPATCARRCSVSRPTCSRRAPTT